ncbi:MAG: hypothetical protein P4L81_02545, partial [Candidatus Pacebacteria bacterium]|nr:hypothetical protein [Candidatus Paceibacterota bacterium]
MVKVLLGSKIDRDRFIAAGYEAIAHVPHVFDSNGSYCREINHFLRERALGDWTPQTLAKGPSKKRHLRGGIDTYAYDLANFQGWIEKKKLTLNKCTYHKILEYQGEQASGFYSSNNKKLGNATANRRADIADQLFCWGRDRGHWAYTRNTLISKKSIKSPTSARHAEVEYFVRPERLPEPSEGSALRLGDLPTPAELDAWLKTIRERRGEAKWQVVRFLLGAGLRSMEFEALLARQIPRQLEIDKWRAGHQSCVAIDLVVTKGGKPRRIHPPIAVVQRLRTFLDSNKRGTHELRWKKYFKIPEQKIADVPCFLSDRPDNIGRPIRKHTIYRLMKQIPIMRQLPGGKTCELEGMSPHKLRHIFACCYL